MIDEFVTLYNSTWGSQPFSNLTNLAAELGWSDIISQSTMDYFDSQNINARWTREMVEAATRVNYGQARHSLSRRMGQYVDCWDRTPTRFMHSRASARSQPRGRRLLRAVTGRFSINS